MSATSADAALRRARFWRTKPWHWALAVVAVVIAVATGAWLSRGWLLPEAAALWTVSDAVGPADAAVVLGGGVADRPFAAAQYYQQGLVRQILVSNDRQNPAEKLGIVISDVAANRAVLLKLGVPATAIETFGDALASTHQEALALRVWAGQHDLRSIIVPTEAFSARRVRWILHRAFASRLQIRVVALDPPEDRRDNWWRDESGVAAFFTEVSKYLYYRLKY
jgi:uncharacterized SAM-binding protein YcdF (DUF218 family)